MICINTSYRCICIRKAMGSFSVPLFTWWNCISTAHSLKIMPIVLFLRKLSIFNLFMIKFSDFLWTALLLVSLETPLIAAEVWILNTVMVPLCSVLEEATPGLPGRRSSRSIYSHGSSRASLFLRGFFLPPSWDTDRYSQILEPQSNKCGPQISTVEAATRTRASRGRTEWTARTFWCHFCPRNPTAVSKTAMNFLGVFWSCFLHITGCFRRNHVVGVQAAMWVFCSFPPPLFNRVFPLSICCGIAAS